MRASAQMGRVGALAVFLGIGAAVSVAHAGAAQADREATSHESVSASGPSRPGGTASTHARGTGMPARHPSVSTSVTSTGSAAARQRVVPQRVTAQAEPDVPLSAPAAGVPVAATRRRLVSGAEAVKPVAAQLSAADVGNVVGQLNFAVHQAVQVAVTVTQAALNAAASAVARLLGITAPSPPPLTGVGNPIIPTFVGANGLVTGSADPSITYSGGQYYATYTTWDHIEIRSAPSIALLSIATPTVVLPSGGTPLPPDQSAHIWAPELHLLTDPQDGQQHWYLYYTAESPGSQFYTGHRIFVLRSEGDTPLGPYAATGTMLDTKTPSLTIDPTVYQATDGRQYLFFSAYPSSSSTGTEDLYVQALKNPTTTEGDPVLISAPTYDWERRGIVPGGGINEGPSVLVNGNTLNVVYSGGTYFLPVGYSLGVLSVPTDANLLDPQTWVNAKQPTPLLTSSPVTGVWSPGHNSFYISPDGTQTWIAYHAYSGPLQGLPALLSILGFPSPEYRTTRIQQVSWTSSGTPVLGVPGAVTVPAPSPAGDPGLTAQFEGAPVSTHSALTVQQDGTAFVGGAGVRVLLTPSGSVTFTVTAPDGTYDLYLRQVPDSYGGRYTVGVDDGPAVAVESSSLSMDLGQATVTGGSLTVHLTSDSLAIADLDEIVLIKSG